MIQAVTSGLSSLLTRQIILTYCRSIYTTKNRRFFHENDNKGGYPRKSELKPEWGSTLNQMRGGFKYVVEEASMFWEEVKEWARMDPTLYIRTGEVDARWEFNGDPEILEKWIVTTDSDYGEGNSTARF